MKERSKTTRRQLLQSGVALAGANLVVAKGFSLALPGSCTLTAELTEGPYYVDYELVRKNIVEDKKGLPLLLRINLLDRRTCQPLSGAAVDVWHCDAAGLYSGFTKMNPDVLDFGNGPMTPGGPPPPPKGAGRPGGPPPGGQGGPPPPGREGRGPMARTTDKEIFLRGVQISNNAGYIEFETIYPGWYVTRDIHIHLKVHIDGQPNQGKYSGGHVAHIGQIAFSDELSDQVALLAPYNLHKAKRTRLSEDSVFRTQEETAESMLKVTWVKPQTLTAGLQGEVTFWVDPAATPEPVA